MGTDGILSLRRGHIFGMTFSPRIHLPIVALLTVGALAACGDDDDTGSGDAAPLTPVSTGRRGVHLG